MPMKIVSPEGHAWCGSCKQHLPTENFRPRGGGRKGWNPRCKQCDLEHNRKRKGYKPRFNRDAQPGMSWCAKCNVFKPVADFNASDSNRNGLHSYCKPCLREYRNNLPEATKARNRQQSNEWGKKHRIYHPVVHKYKFPETPIASVELAYLAGLFDAEGTFVFKHGAPCAAVFNNNKALLQYVQEIIGGCILEIGKKGTDWYTYHLVFGNQPIVKKLCESLIPFLTLKRRRAEILVESMDVQRCNRGDLISELSVLNMKGQSVEPPAQKEEAVQRALQVIADVEWAYFAGWIDGDGVLQQQRQVFETTYYYPKISVWNTKLVPLLWLHERFGGKIEWRNRGMQGHATEFSLRFDDSQYAAKLLEYLRPFIYAKSEQVEVLLDSMKYDPKERQPHFDRMKELNSRHRHVSDDEPNECDDIPGEPPQPEARDDESSEWLDDGPDLPPLFP